MHIEVWSDVVCPWCYIGKRRLEEALRAFPGEVTVTHRAFQLDPDAQTNGERTVDHLAAKYGVSAEQAAQMMSDVSAVANTVGLDYHLDRTLSGNTRDAHRLILWAQDQGKGPELLEALYAAYFTRGEAIFTVDDLRPIAVGVGLDADTARAMLASDAFVDAVREDQAMAASFGANGVPFFVIDRRYGISGAQPLAVFEQTLAQAAQPA